MDPCKITTDFISTDQDEPIILLRNFPLDKVLEEIKFLFGHKSFSPSSHGHVRDESFIPPVMKKCSDISTGELPVLQELAVSSVINAAVTAHHAGHNKLSEFLSNSTKRKLWKGPSIMVYGEDGFMSAHRDKADVHKVTGRPLNDGLLIGINVGLSCYFYFKTRSGHKSTIIVPSGSVVIFDAVLTEHAIKIIPNSCPEELSQKYPILSRYRLSIISRQSLNV